MADTGIAVEVVDANGRAVEGAIVAVERGTGAYPEMAYVADAAGRVVLPVAAGRYVIGASDPRSGRKAQAEVATGADQRSDLRLTLPR